MAAELERVKSEVAEMTSVVGGAVALFEVMAEKIRENAEDPAALNALADELDSSGNALAAAIAKNTPAEEPAPEG